MESQSTHFSPELKKIDEEFNNFMHRVNEINGIVKKLASKDKQTQEMGAMEADQFLKDTKEYTSIDEETVEVKIKTNRTLINKKALVDEQKDENTMSQGKYVSVTFLCVYLNYPSLL